MIRRRLFGSLGSIVAAVGISAAQSGPPVAAPTRIIAVTSRDAASLRESESAIGGMIRDGSLVKRKTQVDTLLAGRMHERYDQYFEGLRVIGGDISRQSARGLTESVFGRIYAVSGLRTRPTLSEDDARQIFANLATRELPHDRPVRLVILPQDDGTFALAYQTHIWTDEGWMQTFLDAHSGEVALQYNDLHTQAAVGTGTGVLGDRKKISTRRLSGGYVADDGRRPPTLITYDMQGNYRRTDAYLDGVYQPTTSDMANDTDNVWTDGGNVDAHVHLGWTYDYYFKRFGRRGLDDRNAPIYAVSHPVHRADIFTLPPSAFYYVANAFWCGGCGPQGRGAMVFGEGLPPGFVLAVTRQTVDFLAGGLDIVAHELTHGLTQYSSDLIYRDESGALDEAFSDIVGTSVEFFYQPAGSSLRQADYLLGEDIFRPGGIRSAADPGAFGDPDHYSRRFRGTDDFGGVHTNALIATHAFYLAIEGGVNRTSGLGVQGVGGSNREQIEKVFYRAFVFMMPSNATFSVARATTIQAARDLYGAGSPAEHAVIEAWTAVGVQ